MAPTDTRREQTSALLRGERVRVRSREEILATLSADGTAGGLPFMPEMLQFCGTEQVVSSEARKTCDTINEKGTVLRMRNTVHLTGSRCDGSAHGGCQAGCLLFWREEWIERADAPGQPVRTPEPAPGSGLSEDDLVGTTQLSGNPGEILYRCQATNLLNATTRLKPTELDQYVADVRAGNATVLAVLRGMLIDLFNRFQASAIRRLPRWLLIAGGRTYPFLKVRGNGKRLPTEGLQAGDLVEVRSKDEILATLGPNFKNGGMLFDGEMLPYCGRRFRVERAVEQIVDEKTGKMIKLSDCYVLENVVCNAIYHRFCPRQITPYWREAWLRRVPEHESGSAR